MTFSDIAGIARLDRSGLIVTAPGDGDYDFVSRYFAPAKGIPEDPVTGAAHCMLTPYWARRLNKKNFAPFRLPARRRGHLPAYRDRGRAGGLLRLLPRGRG